MHTLHVPKMYQPRRCSVAFLRHVTKVFEFRFLGLLLRIFRIFRADSKDSSSFRAAQTPRIEQIRAPADATPLQTILRTLLKIRAVLEHIRSIQIFAAWELLPKQNLLLGYHSTVTEKCKKKNLFFWILLYASKLAQR